MNKFGLVLGVAAAAAIAGCKDPNYSKWQGTQNEPQPVTTTPVEKPTLTPEPVVTPEKEIKITVEERHCTCPPGTVHKTPCTCGAPDCKCIVEAPATVVTPVTPAAEETTPYIVQRGDYLAKISKKYNITIAAIKRVNPGLKGDTIRVGQTIQLPGKVDVGEQKMPVVAPAAPKVVKEYKPYTGATKDYKVQNGDYLGLIAKKHGITVRQLKELNGLTSDTIRVGKTLKVPTAAATTAVAVASTKAPAAEKKPVAEKKAAGAKKPADTATKSTVATATPAAVDEKKVDEQPAVETPVVEEGTPAEATPAVEPTAPKAAEEGPTHVVREGEDLTSLSILYSLSPAEIRAFNNLAEDEELKPGQVIKLPADTQL